MRSQQAGAQLLTSAIPLVRVQRVAAVTATAEAPDGVPAPSVAAQAVDHPALIYIWDTDRETDRQAGRQMGRETDRETDRQTDREIDRQ